MFKNYALSAAVLLFILFTACDSKGQNENKQAAKATAAIEVIQFHSEHRCVTCLKIEKLTRATLAKAYPSIPFRLVNVDDKKNEKMAGQFEAAGTALFLYNPKTAKKQNLTDFAFMKAGNETQFDTELKKFIADFLKS